MTGLLLLLMLQSILMGSGLFLDSDHQEECEIEEINGFLLNVCGSTVSGSLYNIRMKCIHSDEFYNVTNDMLGRSDSMLITNLCRNDPYFYQACAADAIFQKFNKGIDSYASKINPSKKLPCGFLCSEDTKYISRITLIRDSLDCTRAEHDCTNPVLNNKTSCSEVSDHIECIFTFECNGFSYALWCDKHTNYVPAYLVCDGLKDCEDGMDENSCKDDIEIFSTCTSQSTRYLDSRTIRRPLYNFTRCRPIKSLPERKYCEDFMDQTNCTDITRIGLHCPIHGYMSTVARQAICSTTSTTLSVNAFGRIPPICDDKLDKACVTTSHSSCLVHKHQLCDGSKDCQDGSDETQLDCQFMTDQHCVRRFVFQGSGQSSTNFSIPLTWVRDGISDCLNREDEKNNWPTCGKSRTFRLKGRLNSSCSEVFFCPGSDDFIVFSRLCDKIDSCFNENRVCEKSRDQPAIIMHALRAENNDAILLYCLNGLDSILYLKKESCIRQTFNQSERKVFGKNHSLSIWSPKIKRGCEYFYGELYVFLSCLQMCTNSRCPLKPERRMGLDLCPGQSTRSRVFSVDDKGNLAVLKKNAKTHQLSNDIFFCKDGLACLTYDKVCNLVDDCKDGSDESMCDNHFQCEESREYISLNQKCDRILHCLDLSDECNDSCGGTIINGSIGLKVMAWLIGIVAIFFNFYSLMKNIINFRACRSEAAFITNGLVILINIGDFLIGIYLMLLASFDSYYGSKHCKMQTEWLTSTTCVSLGIVNFLGSEISLFSMTALSIIRAVGSVQNTLSVPKDTSRKSVVKIITIAISFLLISFLISYWPMFQSFEDYFVNGVKYEKHNTLFLGCPGKRKHMSILGEYYGRMRPTGGLLSWSEINSLIASMFSKDYGGIQKETLSFYGNDPVCVFKYFVRMGDPQKYFSLVILSLNCLCFVTITVSYFAIALASRNSIRTLKSKAENKTQNSVAEDTNARLQRVVHMIILSDFLCWIPFTITCWLHFFNVVDAEPWYPTFSILVLPINSVVNPVLYDKTITRAIDSVYVRLRTKLSNKLRKRMLSQGPGIELENRVKDKVEEEVEKCNVATAEL